MKAIAKYLPITKGVNPEVININDLCLELKSGGVLCKYLGGDKFFNYDINLEIELPDWHKRYDYRRAKLFAVTQDIGYYPDLDKIWNEERGEYDKIKAADKTMYVLNNCTVSKDKVYKILGEISLDATFVKDGEEYEVIPCDSEGEIKESYRVEDCRKINLLFYKVQCPTCNTYH